MKSTHVYDKAKYHYDSVQKYGLSEDHAENHTLVMLRWLIENGMMSEEFEAESADMGQSIRDGKCSVPDVYRSWDCCLLENMLSDDGNAFAMHYFEYSKGRYLRDYVATLQRGLPTELHVEYNEDNYQTMRAIMDRHYAEWKNRWKLPWPFRK